MVSAALPAHLPLEDDAVLSEHEMEQSAGTTFNLERVRSTLVRNRWLILGTLLVFILGAAAVTTLMRPVYTAFASVQIEQQAAKVLGSEDAEPMAAYQDADRFLQTQVDVLKSRSLAERVADVLRLDVDGRFITAMGSRPPELVPDANPRTARREQVVTLLMRNLAVDLPRNSRVAMLSFDSPTPTVARDVVNAFAQQFIISNLRRRFEATSYARSFLESRLSDVRRRLENSERQINDYARDTGLIDVSNAAVSTAGGATAQTGGPRSLTLARLVQLNSALVSAQTERTEAEERWSQAQRTSLMSLPEVLGNGAIQQLVQQRAQLVAAYEEEKQRRREAYPTMMQGAARIAELDQQITRMAQDIKRSISDTYRTAVAQERQTAADIGTLERSAHVEQDRGVRYNILRREVDTNRELYDGLLQRYKELSAESGVTTNNISIVDRAEVPRRPTSPRLLLNLALASALALIVAAMLVIGRETFDDRVRLPEDVSAKLGLPLLGTIPKLITGSSPRDELELPKSELSEAYQALRATLELSTSRGLPRSLLVTSSRPSEGKSTSSYAIARTLARQGHRVVLVDGDLRRPSLHKVMKLDNQTGLSNLLTGSEQIEAVVKKLSIPNLSVITSGPMPPDPANLLGAEVVRSLIGALAAHYDVLVVDAPPVLGIADTLELASAVDGVLFVVEAGSMHFGGVRSGIKRLRDVRANMLGVVLNKFDVKAVGYGSSYSYSYTYKYSS